MVLSPIRSWIHSWLISLSATHCREPHFCLLPSGRCRADGRHSEGWRAGGAEEPGYFSSSLCLALVFWQQVSVLWCPRSSLEDPGSLWAASSIAPGRAGGRLLASFCCPPGSGGGTGFSLLQNPSCFTDCSLTFHHLGNQFPILNLRCLKHLEWFQIS